MKIVVQKFGGTSLKEEKDRLRAVTHVQRAVQNGYKVVIVVSAMGRKGDPYATDTLLGLVNNGKGISKREIDLLVSCGETISSVVFSQLLRQVSVNSQALTGGQAGFRTSEDFTSARIIDMKCDRILDLFENHDAVVVAGFQGQTSRGDITTIGRGGSDTSAAALGAALQAEWVDIFTDVEGVMTADPRIVQEARHLPVITYNEICNMAYQGAKVIHPRAVEIAMHAKVPLRIRSTHSDSLGTLVTSLENKEHIKGTDVHERLITGIAYLENVTQIHVTAKDGDLELQTKVFKSMAEKEISVDFFNITPNGVIYTVMDPVTDLAIDTLHDIGYEAKLKRHCAKVSAVGAGIAGVPGVTSKIVNALAEKGIQILQSADSHTTIWVLIMQDQLHSAVNALHKAFELDKEQTDLLDRF